MYVMSFKKKKDGGLRWLCAGVVVMGLVLWLVLLVVGSGGGVRKISSRASLRALLAGVIGSLVAGGGSGCPLTGCLVLRVSIGPAVTLRLPFPGML